MPQRTRTGRSFTLARSSRAASSVHITAVAGKNSRICFSIRATLVPAASPFTARSGFSLTISSVWVPMEPVEPRIAMFFIRISFLQYSPSASNRFYSNEIRRMAR